MIKSKLKNIWQFIPGQWHSLNKGDYSNLFNRWLKSYFAIHPGENKFESLLHIIYRHKSHIALISKYKIKKTGI